MILTFTIEKYQIENLSSAMFRLKFNQYHKELQNCAPEITKVIPIKNNKIFQNHMIVYGDGNMKINRDICQMPSQFLNQNNVNEIQTHCEHSPIRGNGINKQYNCCTAHLQTLLAHELKNNDINDFLAYSNALIRYHKTKSDNVKSNMVNFINQTFSEEQIKNFKIIFSSLSKNQSNNKDILTLRDVVQEETENDEFMDELNSCRKGKNMIKPISGKSGGTKCWMTCSGFILSMKETLARETPTEVLLQTFDIFSSSQDMEAYYARILCFGKYLI